MLNVRTTGQALKRVLLCGQAKEPYMVLLSTFISKIAQCILAVLVNHHALY